MEIHLLYVHASSFDRWALFEMDEESASMLASTHRLLGKLEGMAMYLDNKDAIYELIILKECCYSRLIDYAGQSFYEVLKSRASGKAGIDCVTSIACAYKYSLGKKISNPILTNVCSVALYGPKAETEIEIRKKQTFLSNVVTNLKHYNPTAPDHILPAIADISAFLLSHFRNKNSI